VSIEGVGRTTGIEGVGRRVRNHGRRVLGVGYRV
jgi:hypothetical protein